MMNKYSLFCILLLPHYCFGAVQESPPDNKQVVVEDHSLVCSKLMKMLSEPSLELPRVKLFKQVKATGFLRPNVPQIVAGEVEEKANTGFLSYRNSTPDEKLLALVMHQQGQGGLYRPINVAVSIWSQGIISFNIEINLRNDDKLDALKHNIASMAQWRGQFTLPIPDHRVSLSYYSIGGRERFPSIDSYVKLCSFLSYCYDKNTPLKAFVDMSDCKKPEEKSE